MGSGDWVAEQAGGAGEASWALQGGMWPQLGDFGPCSLFRGIGTLLEGLWDPGEGL